MADVWLCVVWMFLVSTGMVIGVDYPWTVSLTVSNQPGNELEGTVEVLGQFQNDTWHSVLLPANKYELGREYMYPVSFPSPGPLDMVYIRTHGQCLLGLLPLGSLHLQKMALVSLGNVTYAKKLEGVVIKDVCEMASDSPGTEIRGFDRIIQVADIDTTDECLLDGTVYSHGQSFDMNCRSRCTCVHGSVECVDKCQRYSWFPDHKCRLVRVAGQCCEETRCEEDGRMQTCQFPKNSGVLKGELVNGLRSIQGGVQRYPWAVLLCVDDKCKSPFGGVIVGDRHILTFGPDLRDAKMLRVASGKYFVDMETRQQDADLKKVVVRNVFEHPDFVKGNASTLTSPGQLQIVEFWEPFSFNQEFQAANLPLSNGHCSKLSSTECPLMTVGWDTANTELYQRTRQMYLHAQVSHFDPQLCDTGLFFSKNPVFLPTLVKSRNGSRRMCIGGLARQDCTGPMGGLLVVTTGDNTDFVIGLIEQGFVPSECPKTGTARGISVCRYLDWIVASIG